MLVGVSLGVTLCVGDTEGVIDSDGEALGVTICDGLSDGVKDEVWDMLGVFDGVAAWEELVV